MSVPWYRSYVTPLAETHQVEPALVEAVILQESSGKANAYRYEPEFFSHYLQDNPAYAGQEPRRVSASYGLMQILYPTARDRGWVGEPEMLFVPQVNLDIGCAILADLFQWSGGDIAKAFAAYNGGKGNWRGVRPQVYASEVLAKLKEVDGSRA